jgi:hypothetical protein
MPTPSWCGNEYPPQGGAGRLSHRCYSEVRRGNELPNSTPKIKNKFSVTANVDNNCSGSLSALDRNCLCVVEVPSVLADASLRGRPNSGLSCMTLRDMLEYTQTISAKCRQTTRAVIIYIGCDRKLLFRFSVFSSGVQPSELHRKTDHLFGDVKRPAPPWIGAAGWYTSLPVSLCLTKAEADALSKSTQSRLDMAGSFRLWAT